MRQLIYRTASLLLFTRSQSLHLSIFCLTFAFPAQGQQESCSERMKFLVGAAEEQREEVPFFEKKPILNATVLVAPKEFAFGVAAKIPAVQKAAAFQGHEKLLGFLGTYRIYSTHDLSLQNPALENLQNRSSADFWVLEVAQVVDVEVSSEALQLALPTSTGARFLIKVTTKNIYDSPLCDATLRFHISPGPFRIVGGDSFYSRSFHETYLSLESKVHEIVLERREQSHTSSPSHLRLAVAFSGYRPPAAESVSILYGSSSTVIALGDDARP